MTLRVAALLLAGVLFCNAGFGREAAVEIPSGPLQQALETLSQLTGLQILYDPVLVQGRTTSGLHGTMTPRAALSELLASTDIVFNFTGEDAVALFRKTAAGGAAGPLEQPISPHLVTISSNRAGQSYNTNVTLAGSRVEQSALTVPFSSESLTAAILRDRQVNRLEDALEYVSGVEVAPTGQSAIGFQIRGFSTYQYYLDGVRVSPDLHHDGFRDMADIERIDVIKGPASLLYGRTEPGGAINLITKQPSSQPHLSLEQQFGSFDRRRTEMDAGGPLTASNELLYRFDAAYEEQTSFRGLPNRRIFAAPAVTWNPSEATTATLYAEYLNSHDFHDSGLPVIGDRMPAVPVGRRLEAGSEVRTNDIRLGMRGSHVFEDGWTLGLRLDARWITSPRSPGVALADDGLSASNCVPASCSVQRELVAIPVSSGTTYFISMDGRREFAFWGTRHSLLLGIDLFQSRAYSELATRSVPGLATDLFNPVPTAVPSSMLDTPDWASRDTTVERWGGLYAQDQIQVLDRLYLLAGIRVDEVKEDIDNFINSKSAYLPGWVNYGGTLHQVRGTRGRGGVTWQPTSTLSLYLNYIQNFGVSAGLYDRGNGQSLLYLPAETAQEWETGVKFAAADGRASASLAAFYLEKDNISTPILEPVFDNSLTQQLMSAATSTGLEAEFRGEPLPGLQLLANYALIYTNIRNSPAGGTYTELVGYTGNALAGVPRNGASIWTTYRIPWDALPGLKVGFGAVLRDARPGDNANDYELPGFVKCSAVAAYGWQAAGTRFTVQLNVDNMFDKRYYESLNGIRTVVPGAPRSWLATLNVAF